MGVRLGSQGSPMGMASLMPCAVLACMKVGIPGTNGVARFCLGLRAAPGCHCLGQALTLKLGSTLWR